MLAIVETLDAHITQSIFESPSVNEKYQWFPKRGLFTCPTTSILPILPSNASLILLLTSDTEIGDGGKVGFSTLVNKSDT